MKKGISILLVVTVICASLVFSPAGVKADTMIESAIAWAVAIANDDSHGYSWDGRWGPDYDCSSLVITAFENAGCNVGAATYTGNMRSVFEKAGFTWIPANQINLSNSNSLLRGDILLNESSHTEIYLGNGQNVGAHRGYMTQWCSHSSNDGKYHRHGHYNLGEQVGDQDGGEISVAGYYNYPWNGVLRYNEISYDDPKIETCYYDGATEHSDFRPILKVTNPESVSEVNFAVRYENTDWQWYKGEFNGGNAWYCDVLASDLGTGTTITCHAYVKGKNGSYTGYPFMNLNLGKDADPEAINWYYDGATDHSDFRPVIRVANPETVSYVKFAVRYDSTDWKWYDGIFNGGNAWYCDVLSSDLGSGQFIVCHAYVYAKNGTYKGYPLENLKLDKDYDDPILNKWEYETIVEKKEFKAIMRFDNPETVVSVRFAVRNDNTDWKWFDGIFDGENNWYYIINSVDTEITGTIYCHAYVQGKNGFYQGYTYPEIEISATESSTETPTLIPTEKPTVENNLLGDADGDGDISILDATIIQRYLAEFEVPHPEITEALGDVTGDGLDIIDATLIQRFLAEFTVNYPIGEPIA